MAILNLGENIKINPEIVNKACSLAVGAHNSVDEPYILQNIRGSPDLVIFGFPGNWSVNDWYAGESFGETKINLELFPSLRSIGIDEHAKVNKAFLQRFDNKVLTNSDFKNKNSYLVAVGLNLSPGERLKERGVETYVAKLDTEIRDFQSFKELLVTCTLKLEELGIFCKHGDFPPLHKGGFLQKHVYPTSAFDPYLYLSSSKTSSLIVVKPSAAILMRSSSTLAQKHDLH
ncbi:hypothetical protein CFP56_028393 [Quercus suber]|uniref:Uncharacterized protein n=1 Tax=Quercus suber TaxID=58331 RepID=A0AAW0JT93_QUESU